MRRAVATALNRDEFVKFIGTNLAQPAGSVIPTGNLGWDNSTPIFGQGDGLCCTKGLMAGVPLFPDGPILQLP